MYPQYIDWHDSHKHEECVFTTVERLKEIEPLRDSSEYEPEMHIGFKLKSKKIFDEEIIEVCDRTQCTIIYHYPTEAFYLGVSKDLKSHQLDIVLAYMIVDGSLPFSLLEHLNPDFDTKICVEDKLKVMVKLISSFNEVINYSKRMTEIIIHEMTKF